MEDKFKRQLAIYIITMILEKKNWEYEYDEKEVSFILGNTEFSTKDMTMRELDDLLTLIVNW